MNDVVIEAQNIAKSFLLGDNVAYGRVSELIENFAKSSYQRHFQKSSDEQRQSDTLWALNDVNFTVRRGEVVGLIGRNGAGKSTLLKILARIISPTSGRIRLKGRVGSLLEVGTGFHPELTGRQNIFLNGAILGMTRREIRAEFDDIVAFSEVERFLDTPVKRYSSGMHMRLAFSVAAHLNPEILLVDEVLAVGDAAFQKKCLGKMSDVAKGGRTVLFVSHNLGALSQLCDRAILLKDGRVEMQGTAEACVQRYRQGADNASGEQRWEGTSRPGDDVCRLCHVQVVDHASEGVSRVLMNEPWTIRITFETFDEPISVTAGITLIDASGNRIIGSSEYHHGSPDCIATTRGIHTATTTIPGDLLPAGPITVWVHLTSFAARRSHCKDVDAVTVDVMPTRGVVLPSLRALTEPRLTWTHATERFEVSES